MFCFVFFDVLFFDVVYLLMPWLSALSRACACVVCCMPCFASDELYVFSPSLYFGGAGCLFWFVMCFSICCVLMFVVVV